MGIGSDFGFKIRVNILEDEETFLQGEAAQTPLHQSVLAAVLYAEDKVRIFLDEVSPELDKDRVYRIVHGERVFQTELVIPVSDGNKIIGYDLQCH